MQDYEEWNIDICFISNFNFSKNINKRAKQDIIFEAFLEELEEELVNCEYISFVKKERNDMWYSLPTKDENKVIALQDKIESTMGKYSLLRYFFTQRD